MNFFGGGEEAKPQGPDPVFAGKFDLFARRLIVLSEATSLDVEASMPK